jgi:signal transduction histidine kinase
MARLFLPNLRARLVAVIFLALLPAFVLLVTVAEFERSRALENARLESAAMVQLLKTQVVELTGSTQQVFELLASLPETQNPGATGCNERLAQTFAVSHDYLSLSVASPSGDVMCIAARGPLSATINVRDQAYFQRAIATIHFAVGGYETGPTPGVRSLTFGYPILDASGRVVAVLGAETDLQALNARLGGAELYQHAALLAVDRAGSVILRQPDPQRFLGQNMAAAPLIREITAAREGITQRAGLDGVNRLYAFTTLSAAEAVPDAASADASSADATDFHILVGFDSDYIFAGVNRMLRNSLMGLSVIGIVAIIAAWISAEVMIVKRTQHVVDAALRMRAGDLSARAGLENDRSEVGQLARTFDSMAAALQEREEDNRRLIEQMQQLNSELEFRVVKRTEQLQITNNKLMDSHAELRRLSKELMRVTEQERTRISREIHDQLGQLLTAVKMELRNVQKDVAKGMLAARLAVDDGPYIDLPELSGQINAMLDLIDETIRAVRRIAADLRPGLLDDFGLVAAVEWQVQEFETRTGIPTMLDADVEEDRLTRDMATAAFRVCQEALTNIARHADATAVRVALATHDGHFTLTVADNGRGIDPEVVRRPRSLGVLGMRERARQLDGSVELAPGMDGGTVMTMVLPIAATDGRNDQNSDR